MQCVSRSAFVNPPRGERTCLRLDGAPGSGYPSPSGGGACAGSDRGLAAVVAAGVGRLRPAGPSATPSTRRWCNALFGWEANRARGRRRDRRASRCPRASRIAVYADGLAGARFLRFTPAGDLLVSQPAPGRRDPAGARRRRRRRARTAGATCCRGLDRPHGLDLHDGWLYVAETDAVGRIRFDADDARRRRRARARGDAACPSGGNHWTRTRALRPRRLDSTSPSARAATSARRRTRAARP